MRKKWFLPILFLFFVPPCGAGDLNLFAAASMTDAMVEISEAFGRQHPEVTVVRNFASSGTLAKQIDNGAPADLFVSANPEWMRHLIKKGKVFAKDVEVLAYNRLVFVGKTSVTVSNLTEAALLDRIALGSPKSVPAGRYTEQALQNAGLYKPLLEQGKLVMAKDVRQALMYAELGEVDGAFVYSTDGLLAKNAGILFEVPVELYPQIVYPAVVTVSGRHNPEALEFMHFLRSEKARGILRNYGFSMTGDRPVLSLLHR